MVPSGQKTNLLDFLIVAQRLRSVFPFHQRRSMKTRFTVLASIILFVAFAFLVRAQSEKPKPAPELKKLDYFVGTWTAQGNVEPGPLGSFGPGGKFTG